VAWLDRMRARTFHLVVTMRSQPQSLDHMSYGTSPVVRVKPISLLTSIEK